MTAARSSGVVTRQDRNQLRLVHTQFGEQLGRRIKIGLDDEIIARSGKRQPGGAGGLQEVSGGAHSTIRRRCGGRAPDRFGGRGFLIRHNVTSRRNTGISGYFKTAQRILLCRFGILENSRLCLGCDVVTFRNGVVGQIAGQRVIKCAAVISFCRAPVVEPDAARRDAKRFHKPRELVFRQRSAFAPFRPGTILQPD